MAISFLSFASSHQSSLITSRLSSVSLNTQPSPTTPSQSLSLNPQTITSPSPSPPPSLTCALQCQHFQSCSGCTHEMNLHRPIILDEAVDFFRNLGVSDFTFDTCRLWGWRCRAKLAVRGSAIDPLIGLYEEGSHNVVDIPHCRAHHPNINAAVELLKEGITKLDVEPYDEDEGTGELRYVQMAITTYNTSIPAAERYRNGKVQVSLVWNARSENSPSSEKLNALANFLWRNGGPNSSSHLVHSVWVNFQTSTNNIIFGNRWKHLLGERDFWEHVGGIDISLAPSSFGQANTRAFDSLLRKLHKYVPYGSSVADLYAGAGSIGLSLAVARKCRQEPLSWLEGSDVVVVDPPRKGLDYTLVEALQTLASTERKVKASKSPFTKGKDEKDEKRPWILRARESSVQIESKTPWEKNQSFPRTLIYISCGWESFKEDCRSLLSNKAWRLEKAHGFNFFPGTQSVEVLAVFKRGPAISLKKKKIAKKKKKKSAVERLSKLK
ncbi:hypothetical protein GIB67_002825 [Kingdonia uniflora]|uniref:RNA methyltransferase n=1 Tax=Kingdonia uniflora TaxID=39325 RepID=A0A7J7M594_9MAGN|nr:hypothetical protein GIB67_002825 [Kingdonia uniflora]